VISVIYSTIRLQGTQRRSGRQTRNGVMTGSIEVVLICLSNSISWLAQHSWGACTA